jgi:hypothetical protein
MFEGFITFVASFALAISEGSEINRMLKGNTFEFGGWTG